MKVEQDSNLSPGAAAGYQERHERGRDERRVGPQGQPRGVGAGTRPA